MITLYTPATGFPDLEVKIAYGLARVAIEAGYEPTIIPQKGFYQIEMRNFSSDKFSKSFLMLLNRLLSSNKFYDLGVKAKDKTKYSVTKEIFEEIQEFLQTHEFEQIFSLRQISDFNFKKGTFCGHKDIKKFGGSSGLILLSSFHAGKPYFRDKIFDKFNLNLCENCGYLAVLGLYSFGFIIQMGSGKNRKYMITLPIPEKEIGINKLYVLMSLQKRLHNFWLSDLLPIKTFLIGLLAKVPSLSDIVNELELQFHLTLVSKDNRGDTVVDQTAFVDALAFSKYISVSPYNIVTVENLLGDYKQKPKVSSLIELVTSLDNYERNSLLKFARLYVQETSTNNWTNFLYLETANYLLKEVGMIPPNIIENPALQSLARTLRYFIRERKYGYADDIRNARKDSRDFEETIAKMLRESRLRLEQKEKIHLPTDEEIKETFHLANEDFESTKLALVMLAFSVPSKREEQEAEGVEDEV
jgi:CRISPR type I-A-associated protein Csa5